MISRDEDDEVVNKRAENDLSATEAQQGLEEHESNTQGYLENTQEHVFIEAVKYSGEKRRQGFGLSAIPFWIRRIWASQSLMRLRLATSKFTRAVRHSSHLRHALKNAVGVAMLSLPAFLPKGSTGECNLLYYCLIF
jgi:transcriptional regulator of aromatic amino acid metabolism